MNRSSSQRHDSSRGGSRRGQNRTDFNAPVDANGWSITPPPRNAGKVGDLGNFGKIEKRASAGPGSFGPSTVFGKKGRNASVETPPISRTPSAGNMFALLNQDSSAEGGAPSAESNEPAPQRKRLVLAPRSKPLPGAGEDGEEGDEAEGDDEEAEANDEKKEPEMDEKTAKAKIEANLAEFYHVKVSADTTLATWLCFFFFSFFLVYIQPANERAFD